MPDRSAKVRWSQLKVGVVGLTAFLILSILIFLLTSSKMNPFQRNATLHTFMDDASGITASTPVRLNGITIGSVDNVALSNSGDPKRTVQFDLLVEKSYLPEIPVDSLAGITASNLLGDKFINITKGRAPRHLEDGGEIKSLQAQGDIPELMAQSANLLTTFQTIVSRLDTLLAGVEQGKGNIGKLLKDEELYDRLNAIGSEMEKLLADVRGGHGTISKLIYEDTLYQELRSPLQRMDAILADLQAGQGSAGKLLKDPALFDEAKQSLAEIRQLLADVNAGKGTVGKLMKDDQLHQHLDQLVAKFNATIDKINAGQGTLGQFMVNPQLYDTLNGATREFQSLAKDIRANPKKFLTIRLTIF
jgi:phospholipid/cholesterol/gamma-HCH transport system substrate-binding protein